MSSRSAHSGPSIPALLVPALLLGGCVADPPAWRQDGTFASTVVTRHGPKVMSGPKGVVVKVSGRHMTIPCQAGALTVDGNGNRLTLGPCSHLVVDGHGNRIQVAFTTPGAIELMGNHNHVTLTAPADLAVPVGDVGHGNSVKRVTG